MYIVCQHTYIVHAIYQKQKPKLSSVLRQARYANASYRWYFNCTIKCAKNIALTRSIFCQARPNIRAKSVKKVTEREKKNQWNAWTLCER